VSERSPESIDELKIREPDAADQRLADRFKKSREDRVVLARFLAACLVVIAIVNVVPAVIYWYRWNSFDQVTPLPRWIYLQMFAALLHVIYAVFLIQVPDWATLKAVSFAMLAIAMSFGLISTGLTVGDGGGFVPVFLGLTPSLIRRAGLWCVAMLCVATLASYLGGRESARWQRAEKLLFGMQNSDQNRQSSDA
jgi:hypothetical protein